MKEAPLQAAAAWASYTIGDGAHIGKITPEQQDLLHSVVGAAYGAALNPNKPLEGAASGAANAFIAARASKTMFGTPEEVKAQAEEALRQQGRPITEENTKLAGADILHQKTVLPTLAAATATALITQSPALTSTAITVATNVTENNCIPSMAKSLMAAQVTGSASEEFWQEEFQDPRDVYYQRALVSAFPTEDLSKISTVVRAIKQFREDNPRLTALVHKGLEGIGIGMQYSYYATALLAGFALGEVANPLGGGVVGASLNLALAKSLETAAGEALGALMNSSSPDSQALLTELLPMAAVLGFRQGRLPQVWKGNAVEAVSVAANKNVRQQLHLDYTTPEAEFSLRIDPHTGQGPMHIDSKKFTSADSLTYKGEFRNAEQFWALWDKKYPGTLSAENIQLMKARPYFVSPQVDQQWVLHFPEHGNYLGETLIHHHIDHGNLVTALPKSVHSKNPGRGYFHQNLGGESQ